MCDYSIPWGKNWARSDKHSSLLQTLKDCERWEAKENSDPLNGFYFFPSESQNPNRVHPCPFWDEKFFKRSVGVR